MSIHGSTPPERFATFLGTFAVAVVVAGTMGPLLTLPSSATAQSAELPALLEADFERELALSALPVHLRAEASVYVLRRGGYVADTEGSNGFSCIVRRSGAVPGAFAKSIIPICYDAVGSATLLPAVFEEVRLLEQGQPASEVAAAIRMAWSDGQFSLPGPGISYMLSPVFCLNGTCGGYVPHTMFYAPFKTDADIGATDDRFDHVPFVQSPGLPSAVMVIPTGEREREAITEREAALLRRVEAYMGYGG